MKCFTVRTENIFVRLLSAITLLLCVFISNSFADSSYFYSSLPTNEFSNSHIENLDIKPVYLMNDETLFLAAAAERDSSMTINQRFVNKYWMLNDKKDMKLGMAGAGALLRMSLHTLWDMQLNSKSSMSHTAKTNKTYAISKLENYDVDISEDEFSIRFKFKF